MLGRCLPGDKLPSERSMAEQFGVSRTSIREAIRVLVRYGLLEIKRGATGGAIVRDMIGNGVRERMRSFARARKKDYVQLLEFRLVVECAAARLAAVRRNPADLRILREHVRNMDSLFAEAADHAEGLVAIRFYAEDTAFHIAIGKASGNSHMHDTIEELRYKLLLPLSRVVAELDERANDKHCEIVDAIEAGDGDLAEALMRAHIKGSFESVFN